MISASDISDAVIQKLDSIGITIPEPGETDEDPNELILHALNLVEWVNPLKGIIVINLIEVDWKLLSDQKAKLIDTRELEKDQRYIEAFSGIIHLIDDIQDQAAKQIGSDTVFQK